MSPATGTSATRAKIAFATTGASMKGIWGVGAQGGPNTNTRALATGGISVGSYAGSSVLDGYIEQIACAPIFTLFPTAGSGP